MMGSFELIRRKCDDPARVRTLAETGILIVKWGAKLISQMLTFFRAEHVASTPVSVTATLDGMANTPCRAHRPRIIVELDIRCGNRFGLFDRAQLEMALLNFVINARDAMPRGGRLTVGAGLRTVNRGPAVAPGEYVQHAVKHDGFGMPPDVAAQECDPFFTTKSVGKGIGLGLSQVHGIVRQAGGTVEIENQPCCGTTVRIMLPCIDAPAATEPGTVIPPESGPRFEATVLLVDDDDDLRVIIAASLQDLGYRVVEAASGAEGLVLLQRYAPDLLVTDFAMPGMTGAELAEAVQLFHPTLPVIFVAGHADVLALEQAATKAFCVLRKPFHISVLHAKIASALNVRMQSPS